MSMLASILGFRSPRPRLEISDDEGSVASSQVAAAEPAKKPKKEEVVEELKVESDKEEEEDEDDEIGEDEYVIYAHLPVHD